MDEEDEGLDELSHYIRCCARCNKPLDLELLGLDGSVICCDCWLAQFRDKTPGVGE